MLQGQQRDEIGENNGEKKMVNTIESMLHDVRSETSEMTFVAHSNANDVYYI